MSALKLFIWSLALLLVGCQSESMISTAEQEELAVFYIDDQEYRLDIKQTLPQDIVKIILSCFLNRNLDTSQITKPLFLTCEDFLNLIDFQGDIILSYMEEEQFYIIIFDSTYSDDEWILFVFNINQDSLLVHDIWLMIT